MCGIIGIIGNSNVSRRLLNGLKRLEYRGYDSAGIATINDGQIERLRAEGKLSVLAKKLEQKPVSGSIGIGHTRWATHGVPNEINAHPHSTEQVAAVHNGIIENFKELREELTELGHKFLSDTDSEAIVHLISHYLEKGMSPRESMSACLKKLQGAFALAIIFVGKENLLFGARQGSPLALGWGAGEMFLGSDAIALSDETSQITYLEEGDWVEVTRSGAIFFDFKDKVVDREITETNIGPSIIAKGNFPHYMLKEIYEQPTVIGETLNGFFDPANQDITLPDFGLDLKTISRVTIIACGTSYFAGLVAKFWIEKYAKLPVEVDIASEFRYRESPMSKSGLALFISQSGETADTLGALSYAREQKQYILSIVNVRESTMARASDSILVTKAGPEIGVASTKAFTCQLVTLAAFAIYLSKARKKICSKDVHNLSKAISEVPSKALEVLNHDEHIKKMAHDLSKVKDLLYIGRGTEYPIALEGALKLKEISYIHAEGYAAGELKHGPIALIDESVPVVVVAPSGPLFSKTISNMQEIIARGGKVILLTDEDGAKYADEKVWKTIELPKVDSFVCPILYAIPIQLIAYHVAVAKGTDVDQPRNLAKSVTVE